MHPLEGAPDASQITPAFVREAYSLLRQSIIHVEQDDIDFDEEELEGERDGDRRPRAGQEEESQDVEMSNVESSTMEESGQESFADGSAVAQAGTSSRAQSMAAEAPPPARPKKRFIITHDKYMQLQNLVILQLSEHERLHQRGMDRDELIDWYLEQMEDQLQSIEDLEYERELVMKVLKKLVKVSVT